MSGSAPAGGAGHSGQAPGRAVRRGEKGGSRISLAPRAEAGWPQNGAITPIPVRASRRRAS